MKFKYKKSLLFTCFVIFSYSSQAQEVLTKIDGGASWSLPSTSKPIVWQNSGSLVLNETHYTVVGQLSFNGITLPASNTCDGRIYVIANRGNSNITLGGSGVLVNQFFDLDGSVTTSITAGTSVTLQASSTGWFRIR